MPERRVERWNEPRVIVSGIQVVFAGCSLLVAVLGLIVVVFGGLLGAYVLQQTRSSTSEVSQQQVVSEVQKMSTKLDAVADDVKDLSNSKASTDAKLAAHDKELAENASNIKIVDSKVGVVANKVATLEATVKN